MLNEETLISVIVPHLNQPEALELCLDSLEKQTLARSKFEVIVVDNGSNLSLEPIASRFSKVTFLQELTPGPGPARNRGASVAMGQILAFIDADCIADSEWLSRAVEKINSSPVGSILGGDVQVRLDGNATPVAAYEKVFGFRFKHYIENQGYSGTGNLIVRRKDFEKVGPFAGINIAEDVDWGERARAREFFFLYSPELIVYHPPRFTLAELREKWDRHLIHSFNVAQKTRLRKFFFAARGLAIAASPFFDFLKPLTSNQIRGPKMRLGAIGVLFYIRAYRAVRRFSLVAKPEGQITWNRRQKASTLNSTRAAVRLERVRVDQNRTGAPKNSALIAYALNGLEKCWLTNEKRWSHIYHLDGRDPANQSVPESDTFYTLNVLLGLSRVAQIPDGIDVQGIFSANSLNLLSLPVADYAFGTALWTSAELGIELPSAVLDKINSILSNRRKWKRFKAQDLGMMLCGVVAQARKNPNYWKPVADRLFDFLTNNFTSSSGLFFNNNLHPRRQYTSFATHTYLTLACYLYGEAFNHPRAIDLANACARKLIALQGPEGEWPWFFDTARGQVVDFYEVYSVHQFGMAPAFLELAERYGVFEARQALIKGFHWGLGENQLRKIMLVPELCLTIRSQARKGEQNTRAFRTVRSFGNSVFRRKTGLTNPANVELRLECRSYELGWILWSFGRRADLPELSDHQLFRIFEAV